MGEIVRVNSAVTVLLGFQVVELSGRSVSDLMAFPYGVRLLNTMQQHVRQGDATLLKKKFALGRS